MDSSYRLITINSKSIFLVTLSCNCWEVTSLTLKGKESWCIWLVFGGESANYWAASDLSPPPLSHSSCLCSCLLDPEVLCQNLFIWTERQVRGIALWLVYIRLWVFNIFIFVFLCIWLSQPSGLFPKMILKDVDSLLYVDTDVLFLRPIDDIWGFLRTFNATQLAAMAPEHEIPKIGWYSRFARHPYYGTTGVNSGVMLMNLTRIRNTQFKVRRSFIYFGKNILLGYSWFLFHFLLVVQNFYRLWSLVSFCTDGIDMMKI